MLCDRPVLLIGDREKGLLALADVLRPMGLQFHTAGDAGSAWALVEGSLTSNSGYGVFLIETEMQSASPSGLIERLRATELYSSTPILGLAANVLAKGVETCAAAGMDMVLPQPARMMEIRGALEAVWAHGAALGRTRSSEAGSAIGCPVRYAELRADMLARIDALVGGGEFSPVVLEEVIALSRDLAGSAGMFGDPVTCDLAQALEECVLGFAAGGEVAIRSAAAALEHAT